MNCLNCGAELHKNDIFCINCETPVLTDEDLAALANMDVEEIDIDRIDKLTMSSGRLFDSLSLKENDIPDAKTNEDGINDDFIPRKKSKNRKPFYIAAAAVLCAVIIGFAVFLMLRPSAHDNDEPYGDPEHTTGDGEESRTGDNGDDIPEVIIPAIASIAVLNNGRVQTEFHVSVGESVGLTSKLLPDGALGDVTWLSSDPEVVEVSQPDPSGTEAIIRGLAPGVADIIVKSGDIEETFIVFVDNLSLIMQLENALEDDETAIWLTISWIDADRTEQEVVFERDLENQMWTMESAIERGDIVPTFVNANGAIIMSLPDSAKMYHLFEDGMGFYGNPGETGNEYFMWWFKTTLVEPEG
ncbi:MAG: Ig-like domain-containing protein [Oscillospiraceae bacterium]|nr:Ig-like domain-containing protein [Oscillospiraceae bacterium]